MSAWKRWIAFALSAVMLLSLVPTPAFAGEMQETEESAESVVTVDAAPLALEQDESTAPSEADAEQEELTTTLETDEALSAPLEADEETGQVAELNSAADNIFEIGYRFHKDEPWTIVGADKTNSHDVANYRVFDENGNYAIPLKKGVAFPLQIDLIAWDTEGRSEELKRADGTPFQFEDETSKITIEKGNVYSFSVYADWLEEFSYSYQLNGMRETVTVTSDEDWFRAQADNYLYLPLAGGEQTISLERSQELPITLTFRVPSNAENSVTFSNPSADGDVRVENNSVTFLNQDASIMVNHKQGRKADGSDILSACKFTVRDRWYGEVSYLLPGEDSQEITLGEDPDLAKAFPDTYIIPENGKRQIYLGENDRFPFSIAFSMRSEHDFSKAFPDMGNADGVQVNQNTFVATFQKQDASVKVGNYLFQVHDNRAGEVRYSAPYVGEKTLTRDSDYAENHKDKYIYKEEGDNRHSIQLTENNTFPVEIRFSLPRDAVSEPQFSGNDVQTGKVELKGKNEGSSTYTVSFKENDASVTVAGYTFTAHSPFVKDMQIDGQTVTVGAVRYQIGGRSLIVGPDTQYAEERQAEADKQTAQNRKTSPDSDRVKPDYVAFQPDKESYGSYTIELNEGEYFPREVSFTQWKPDKGWDTETRESKIFDGIQKQSVFGHDFWINADWLNEVNYELPVSGGRNPVTVTVGYDSDKAAVRQDYEVFDQDGNFAIDPNDDGENTMIFPCTVTFTVRNASGSDTVTKETFENSDSKVEIRGHTFRIRSAWKGEAVYTLNGKSKIVGHDPEWAKTHDDYDAVTESEDGKTFSYVIQDSDNLSFPLKVSFRMRNSENETEIEFKNLNDTHKYAGITFSIHPQWLDTVRYTLVREVKQEDGSTETRSLPVTVGTDEERARKSAEDAAKDQAKATAEEKKSNPFLGIPDYLFADDYRDESGNVRIAIQGIEDDAFYPYGIEFTYTRLEKSGTRLTPQEVTKTIWFEGPEDMKPVPVGGYQFVAESRRTDSAKLVSAGLRINAVQDEKTGQWSGGQYIPFVKDVGDDADSYWNDAEEEQEYQASLQSLLPLRERGLYVNLRGFFPDELKNARLEFARADGAPADKDKVAWSEPIEVETLVAGEYVAEIGDLSGTYKLIDNGGPVDVSGQTYYEMVAGQLDQLDMSDIRYIVRVSTNIPGFNNLLNMKAAYANKERGGIRIKGSGYSSRNNAYTFTVNEQWQDGPISRIANTKTMERNRYWVDSVPMNSGTRRRVTMKPFSAPQRVPRRMERTITSGAGRA